MKLLALTINNNHITGAGGVPTGGIFETFNIISLFTGLLVFAGIIIALFFLIWGGFSWITSSGDKQKVNQARDKIFYSIVGLVIIFLAFFIINTLYYFFGLSSGAPCIPTRFRPC